MGGSRTVTFQVVIDEYADLVPGAEAVLNNGSATALGWTDPVDDRAFLRGRISDFVWYDVDHNGLQDVGEGGIAGVTVTLQDGDGNVVYTDEGVAITTVTDNTGLYDFTGLLPGPYVMKFVPPEGSVLTLQDMGSDDGLDSDPDTTTSLTGVIDLGGGQKRADVDAGIWVDLSSPTAVVVSSFGAYEAGDRVVVGWETASETGTAGFFVERLAGEGSNWVRASERLVPALLESPSGGSYGVVDEGAQIGDVLAYRLVEVEISGATRYYGPYEVTAGGSLPWAEASIGISSGMQSVRIPKTAKQEHAIDAEPPAELMTLLRSRTDRMRIEVAEAGLYCIDVADIAAGLSISETRARSLIKTKGLKLTTKGSTVAYLGAGDQSAIYFYGQAIDSIYASNNVYWLTVGKGATMASAKKTSSRVTTVTSFAETLHVEENLVSALAAFHDPQGDFWLWDYTTAGDPDASTIGDIALDAPGALSGVRLDVRLQGLSSSGVANEHHVEVWLNGVALGETWWTGDVAHTAGFDIPEGVLLEQDNQFEMLAILDGGIEYSVVGLDSIDVTYERAATAVDDQSALGFSTACPVVVNGLSSTDAWVFDVTNPRTPQVVRTNDSGDEAGSSWVKFMAVKNREYLVATAAGAMRPHTITATSASRAPSATNSGGSAGGAQYVVITTEALYGVATELAAYRSGGLTTFVTTVDDIYDEFNYGIADPHAIRSFIKNALSKWKIPPSYVVLAGEGSFDYKNYTGNGDSMVPPLMVDSDFGLTPSDVVLADTKNGDGVPEVAIGRLPAIDEDGLRAQIDKIRDYEADEGAWRESVLFAADQGDEAGDFAGISSEDLVVGGDQRARRPRGPIRSWALGESFSSASMNSSTIPPIFANLSK